MKMKLTKTFSFHSALASSSYQYNRLFFVCIISLGFNRKSCGVGNKERKRKNDACRKGEQNRNRRLAVDSLCCTNNDSSSCLVSVTVWIETRFLLLYFSYSVVLSLFLSRLRVVVIFIPLSLDLLFSYCVGGRLVEGTPGRVIDTRGWCCSVLESMGCVGYNPHRHTREEISALRDGNKRGGEQNDPFHCIL